MTASEAVQPRREPTQVRSRRLVARVLAASARVFTEAGFEAATTNRIAQEAGVSVGSLYQFFPNKTALLLALRRDAMTRIHDALGEALAPVPQRALPDLLDRVVDAFEDLDRAHPGLLRLLMLAEGRHLAPDPAHEGVICAITRHVETLLADRAPGLDPERRATVAALCVHLSDGLFLRLGPAGQGFDPALVREVKAALLAYLSPFMEDRLRR